MVMLAVNSEDMFGRGENKLPLIGSTQFQKVRDTGRTGNDMEALEWQVREAYRFQDHIDAKFKGKGNGWYRIVRDPEEASEVIKSGKLAVILGTELQHLFNCDLDRPRCRPEDVVEGLNRLEAMGVNYVFPVHHKLNQFGGPAMFTPVNSGPTGDCPAGYKQKCAKDGLTDLGRFLVKELTARGMLIDTEHLSIRSFNDTMTIVEERRYPVLASHVVPFDLVEGTSLNERAKTRAQISRILDGGGIVAPLLSTSAREYSPVSGSKIPIKCKSKDDGSAEQWANAYLFLRDVAGGAVSGASGRIAIGSDFNGFAGWPGPRDRCDKEQEVTYPIILPAGLVPDAIEKTTQLREFEWPRGKFWNYHRTGLAHAGLLPDFFQNLKLLGLTTEQLEPVYRSARGVVELWRTARGREVSGDYHHLRWTPQSPFDVLNFNYRDSSRDVSARDGFPICRSRSGHLLGFERNGICVLVEPRPGQNAPAPEPIPAYHAGRCLDIASTKEGARIIQNVCKRAPQQLWQVRKVSGTKIQVVNSTTGKCLAVKNSSVSEGAVAIQQTCTGQDNEIFDARRTGNTFRLVAKHSDDLCLEVRDQSRKDGAAIQQARCSGASNQQWSIDSMRSNDYERLYQATKNQLAWRESPNAAYPLVVTVDAFRPICRSTDGQNWVGIVNGGQCLGKTYEEQPAITSQFMQLYQAR